MDIKQRLQRLKRAIEEAEKSPSPEEKSAILPKLRILLREQMEEQKRIKDIRKLAEHLGANVCENKYGKFLLKEQLKEIDYFGENVEKIHLLAKENLFKNFRLDNNVFLDVETSGLSGGVGTFAFLIGIGYLDNYKFCIKQFFLPDLPREKALLTELSSILANFDSITTFNGKSFDLPLLTSRFRLQMLKEPFFKLHLDLLHVARRVYKRSYEDRSLSSLEEKLLGTPRIGDIAGSLIPEIYFNFLRTAEVSLLNKVIKHNEIDVFSMLKLLAHFVDLLKEIEEIRNPEVLYSISRLTRELKDTQTTITLMKRALRFTDDIPLIFEIKRDLSLIFKRESKWNESERLWLELLEETPFEPFPYLELAKMYEHTFKQLDKAMEILECLKEKLGDGWEFCRADDLVKRDKRLKKKMEQ